MLCCGSPGSTGNTKADPFQAGAVLIPQPSTLVRGVHCRGGKRVPLPRAGPAVPAPYGPESWLCQSQVVVA